MMAKTLAYNGAAKIYIVGRRLEKLQEAARASPDNIVPIVGDVTSKDSLLNVAQTIKQDARYLNMLICNSGTMPPSVPAKAAEVSVAEYARKALEQDEKEWATTYATNATAVFFTTMAMLELLDAGNKAGNVVGRQSQVLVTTSIAGFLRNPPQMGAYPSSKAAATHLIKHLAGTLVPYSIRCNGIAPGLFQTELAAPLIASGGWDESKDASEVGAFSKEFIPAERLGAQSDMAGFLLFAASAAGAYMNGNIMVLDGGRIGMLPGMY